MFQEGSIALFKAIKYYKYPNVVPFISYVTYRVNNALLVNIPNLDSTIRFPIKFNSDLKRIKRLQTKLGDNLNNLNVENLVKELKYDLAYTFIFSKREATRAYDMKDDTSLIEKKKRLARLNEVVNENAYLNNLVYLDKVIDVLIEDVSDKDGYLMGYSDTMKLVNVKADLSYLGKIVKVRITSIKTWSLDGEVVEC